jgi:hypothetical protein
MKRSKKTEGSEERGRLKNERLKKREKGKDCKGGK